MFNSSQSILEELKETMKMPEGTCRFRYRSNELLDPSIPGGMLFENIAGGHIFQLVRTDDLFLNFYYSSPGSESQLAKIDLSKIEPTADSFMILFTWKPNEICMYIGPLPPRGQLLSAKGEKSNVKLQVGESGSLYSIGDQGLEVMGPEIFQNGKQELQSTAIQSWKDTKQAIEILLTGKSTEGYLFETIQTNIIISILVTGFEVYCERRSLELEQEGITPKLENYYKPERLSEIKADALKEGIKLFHFIVKQKISFQNYERCKEFYSKIYGIKFGNLNGVENKDLEELQRFIGFRHKIVHEKSILLGILNQENHESEEPIFSNKALANKTIEIFDTFIQCLHQATLELRPTNNASSI